MPRHNISNGASTDTVSGEEQQDSPAKPALPARRRRRPYLVVVYASRNGSLNLQGSTSVPADPFGEYLRQSGLFGERVHGLWTPHWKRVYAVGSLPPVPGQPEDVEKVDEVIDALDFSLYAPPGKFHPFVAYVEQRQREKGYRPLLQPKEL